MKALRLSIIAIAAIFNVNLVTTWSAAPVEMPGGDLPEMVQVFQEDDQQNIVVMEGAFEN